MREIKKKKIVKAIIGIFSIILIFSVCFYISVKDKQENISIEKTKDNRAMAFYIEKNGEYEPTNTFPTSGYKLNEEKSVCSNGAKLSMTSPNSLNIANLDGSTKCYLYFDKLNGLILTDEIKKQSKGEYTEFAGIATEADTGVYSAPDDYGTSYYFRGVEDKLNNWVEFAGFYWRIIRINGNGTVRMIYQGEANGAVSNSNKTGASTQIGTYEYNTSVNDNTYVGYMISLNSNGNSSSYSGAHSNLYDSNAKVEIDKWYQNNIANNTEYSKYTDINTGFCNDRELSKGIYSYSGDGYSTQNSAYSPVGRLRWASSWKTIQTPMFQCSNKSRDLFTVSSANIGNKKLAYPVGLITSDEVIFGGAFSGNSNYNGTYYLYTNQDYWTMSPRSAGENNVVVFGVSPHGALGDYYSDIVNIPNCLRPVINLRADVFFSGDGSEANPYKIVE